MDHTEAVRLQAAEKYVSGELAKADLEAYEEHYFDCPACAEELKATVAFSESTRQVFREEASQAADDKRLAATKGSWFGWLRPAFAVPVFAALLLFIGYQNGVTIPHLKDFSSSQSAQIVGTAFHLSGSVRGGSDSGPAETKIPVHARETFLLNFDFTPSRTFDSYRWQIQDQTGRSVRQGLVDGDKTNQSVYLPVTGGVERAGKYDLVFFGGPDGNALAANEVQRLTFTVEFPH